MNVIGLENVQYTQLASKISTHNLSAYLKFHFNSILLLIRNNKKITKF